MPIHKIVIPITDTVIRITKIVIPITKFVIRITKIVIPVTKIVGADGRFQVRSPASYAHSCIVLAPE